MLKMNLTDTFSNSKIYENILDNKYSVYGVGVYGEYVLLDKFLYNES